MQKNHRYTYTTKRDELFMREKNYNLHQQKLQDIKTSKSIPLHNPMIQTHKLKQIATKFAKEEQKSMISKDNSHLFQKLTNISTRPINQEYYNIELDYHVYSNYQSRKEIQNEIAEQNKKLANRILQQSSTVKFQEYETEYEQIKKIKKRLSRINDQQSYLQKLRNRSSESQKKKPGIKLQPLNQSSDNHNMHQLKQMDASSFSSQDPQSLDNIYLTAVKEEDQEESIYRRKNQQYESIKNDQVNEIQFQNQNQNQDSNIQKNLMNTESDNQEMNIQIDDQQIKEQQRDDQQIDEQQEEKIDIDIDQEYEQQQQQQQQEIIQQDINKQENDEEEEDHNYQEQETKDQLLSADQNNYEDDFEQ